MALSGWRLRTQNIHLPAFFWAAMLVFIKVVHAAWDHGADNTSAAAEGHDPSPTLELLVDGCHHFIRTFGALDGDWVEG